MPRPKTARDDAAALPRSFFARDAATVARAMLGVVLCRRMGATVRRARIVETEAYVGPHDLACHASKGRTPRTAVMFGPPGHAYVYLVYGMHHMLNVVTGPDGSAQAVLLRAAEPLAGLTARLDGPGRLAGALCVTRALCGCDVTRAPLWFEPGVAPEQTVVTARVGVDYAGAWAAAPLRFLDPASACVSRGDGRRTGARRPPRRGAAGPDCQPRSGMGYDWPDGAHDGRRPSDARGE